MPLSMCSRAAALCSDNQRLSSLCDVWRTSCLPAAELVSGWRCWRKSGGSRERAVEEGEGQGESRISSSFVASQVSGIIAPQTPNPAHPSQGYSRGPHVGDLWPQADGCDGSPAAGDVTLPPSPDGGVACVPMRVCTWSFSFSINSWACNCANRESMVTNDFIHICNYQG